MNKTIYIAIFSLFFVLSSCDYFQLKNNNEQSSERVVARVGDENLYFQDLLQLDLQGLSPNDSIKVTTQYIENWARNQILIRKASLNLPEEKKEEFDAMLSDYKKELYINYYKGAVLSQSLDTVLKVNEIEAFYENNKNVFRLNEKLLQYRMFSFYTKDFNENKLKKLFLKNDKESMDKLLEDEMKYTHVRLDNPDWTLQSEFLKTMPLFVEKGKKINPKRFYIIKSEEITTMIYITNVLLNHEIAPLEYVKPVVKRMLLHKKKLEYINNIEKNLINDAIQNKIYEKY